MYDKYDEKVLPEGIEKEIKWFEEFNKVMLEYMKKNRTVVIEYTPPNKCELKLKEKK